MAEDGRADAHRVAVAHRIPVTEVHRLREGARQPARRRRGRGREGDPRLARRPDFYAPDDVVLMYRDAGARGAAVAQGVGRAVRSPTSSPRAPSGEGLHGWEQKLPDVAGRRLGARPASAIEDVLSAVADVVPGPVHRFGRPHRQHRHDREEPRACYSPTTRPGGSSTTASASTGWVRPRTAWPYRALVPCVGHVLRVQRLHASRRAARVDHADEGLLRVDARLGRRRRRRPHAPTDRAARVAAGDARACA